jgi:adenosylmethionine-8-amino-7-oxononanoate aminotransferase
MANAKAVAAHNAEGLARQADYLWTNHTFRPPDFEAAEQMIVRGEGVYVWDAAGRRYLDAFAGLAVVNVGHGRPEIREAVARQLEALDYYPTTRGFTNPPAARLAAKLAEVTPGDLARSLFSVSGSEANERSIQMARHYWIRRGRPSKYKIVSLERGYHGGTIGDWAVCGLPEMTEAYAPMLPAGFPKLPPAYCYRCALGKTYPSCSIACADAIADAIRAAGPDTVSAVIAEPIQSAGGTIVPPIGYMKRLREICDEYDVLLIADEVITGFGRTGTFFGCEHDGVVPDIMSVAKGITSGYLPLAASIATERVAQTFLEDRTHESVHPGTYCAHPVSCAAALANIEILEKEDLPGNAARVGGYLMERLHGLRDRHPMVGEVRGRGLMMALDLKDPRSGGLPDQSMVERANRLAYDRGLIVFARKTVIRLAPPLCLTHAEADIIADTLDDVLKELARAL